MVVTRIRKDGVESCAQTLGLRKLRVNYVRDESVRKELRMRCPRFPFIITDDVRPLNRTPGLDQQDRYTNETVRQDEPAEDQRIVELLAPGSKRSAPSTGEPCASMPVQRKRQKRSRQDPGVSSRTHATAGDNDRSRMSDNDLRKQRRDGNQFMLVPLPNRKESCPRMVLSSDESRLVTTHATDGVTRSSARSTDVVFCDGPTVAAKLRLVIETLTLREKKDPKSVKLAGCCCTGCRSKIDVLDEMISGVIRVARLLEDLTNHQINGVDPGDQ